MAFDERVCACCRCAHISSVNQPPLLPDVLPLTQFSFLISIAFCPTITTTYLFPPAPRRALPLVLSCCDASSSSSSVTPTPRLSSGRKPVLPSRYASLTEKHTYGVDSDGSRGDERVNRRGWQRTGRTSKCYANSTVESTGRIGRNRDAKEALQRRREGKRTPLPPHAHQTPTPTKKRPALYTPFTPPSPHVLQVRRETVKK